MPFSVFGQMDIKPFVVVLDAGHGGKDSGNAHNGLKESKIALDVTLKVGKLLESNPNLSVHYTRKTDVFLGLDERAKIANNLNADLFVSIHCNGFHKSSANGTETFVLALHNNNANLEIAKKENSVIFLEENYEEKYEGFDPNNPASFIGLNIMQEDYLDQSIKAAAAIQHNFTKTSGLYNRGVKQAGLAVLRLTYMPSILV
ncbi:MAG: N-acetylmuramoyl-L-alanine amidase, partial [Flavobacteriaceae bacterium]|nr:N-acetylmuramoyl-L-alanine amidase [Flavobacteriaceae bacterium]